MKLNENTKITLTIGQLRKLVKESGRFDTPDRDMASLGDDIESDVVGLIYTFYNQLAEERGLPSKSRNDVAQVGIDSEITSEIRELALDWLRALDVNVLNDGYNF